MIQTKDLVVGYSKPIILVDDLFLKESEIYAIIGSNGSGKSTFLKTITGQIQSLKGDILIDSKKISELNQLERSKIFAFVKPNPREIEYLKVNEYIALGRTPYTNAFGRLKASDHQVVNEVIEELNIEHLSTKFFQELSDGERQQVTIGRALAQQTPIVILDEPTSFLDYLNKEKILHRLCNLSQNKRKLILFSSHDLDSLIELNIPMLGVSKTRKVLEKVSDNPSKDQLKEQYFH